MKKTLLFLLALIVGNIAISQNQPIVYPRPVWVKSGGILGNNYLKVDYSQLSTSDTLWVKDKGLFKYRLVSSLPGGGMVYPGSGIALSTGSAWGTSITDNHVKWDSAYGWGDHSGLYVVVGRKLNINGTTYDLSADRSWSVGTVTSIATGLGLSGGPITGSGTILVDTSSASILSRQRAAATYQPIGTYPIGSGTANYLTKWATSSSVGNSVAYDDGANVGIGTTAPGAKLDVRGTIKYVDGNEGAGKVLTSDANGMGTWQAHSITYISSVRTGETSIVTTSDTTIAFTSPLASTNYSLIYRLRDVLGRTISGKVHSKTTGGFTIKIFYPSTLEYCAMIEYPGLDIRSSVFAMTTTSDTTITFSYPMPSGYVFSYRVVDAHGHTISAQVKNETLNGFTIKSCYQPVTVEYQATKYY